MTPGKVQQNGGGNNLGRLSPPPPRRSPGEDGGAQERAVYIFDTPKPSIWTSRRWLIRMP